MYGLQDDAIRQKAETLAELFDVRDLLKTPVRNAFIFLIPAIVIYNFPFHFLTDALFLEYRNHGLMAITAILLTALWLFMPVRYFRKSLKYYCS